MKSASVKIGDVVIDVDVAITDKEKYKGLSNTESLEKGKGMLFKFNEPEEVFFVMRDMNYGIDILFIDENHIIIKKVSAKKDYKGNIESGEKIKFVLEINIGIADKFNIGDTVNFKCNEPDNKEKDKARRHKHLKSRATDIIKSFKGGGELTKDPNNAVKVGDVVYDDIIASKEIGVLEDDGFYIIDTETKEAIFKIKGGERVVAITDTEDLFRQALELQEDKIEASELGKTLVAIYNRQDNQKSQFVKAAKSGMIFKLKKK